LQKAYKYKKNLRVPKNCDALKRRRGNEDKTPPLLYRMVYTAAKPGEFQSRPRS